MTQAVLILDCGATSVRAVAVSSDGHTLAKASRPNATVADPANPAWHLWPRDTIVDLLGQCSREALTALDALPGGNPGIAGIAVTTFGVDGAPVLLTRGSASRMTHPVISWKCPRTQAVMDRVDARHGGTAALQAKGGVGRFSFNTIYKLEWLVCNRPECLGGGARWLFMPSLIAAALGADPYTDRTMAGTSGLTDPATGDFHPELLAGLGLAADFFPPLKDAGQPVGHLSAEGGRILGLPAGIPFFAAGHDTQCALLGSGAGTDQPVLSSGTWEILMARTPRVDQSRMGRYPGSTCELDAAGGLLNPGLQWLASGVLEWVKATHFADGAGYDAMIAAARDIPAGSGGVRFDPGFFLSGTSGGGSIRGLDHQTPRAAIWRAAMEGLSCLLAVQLDALQDICGFRAESLVMVGGGTRNALWNQMKADALGIPIHVVDESETTVLGAACAVLAGLGAAPDAHAAREGFSTGYRTVLPGPGRESMAAMKGEFRSA